MVIRVEHQWSHSLSQSISNSRVILLPLAPLAEWQKTLTYQNYDLTFCEFDLKGYTCEERPSNRRNTSEIVLIPYRLDASGRNKSAITVILYSDNRSLQYCGKSKSARDPLNKINFW